MAKRALRPRPLRPKTPAPAGARRAPPFLVWLVVAAVALACSVQSGWAASPPPVLQATPDGTPAGSLACAEARRLEALVSCITGHFGPFVVPSSEAQDDYGAAVRAMLDGACERSILRPSLAGAYDVRPFTDEENGRRYCVLVEVGDANQDGRVDRGWGTFITYPEASRELSIAVPHPIDDSTTQDQGIGVFKGTDSRSFLLAGSRRTLGGPSACQANLGFEASDAAHNVAHPFFAATRALAAWHGSGAWTQLQFHGMSQQTCGSEVHLTNGVTTPPAPTDQLSVLKQNVLKHHPRWLVTVPGDALPDGSAACSLNGTTDTEGRFLNGVPVAGCCSTPASAASGRFIHIEQDPGMRLASDWIQPLLDTWLAVRAPCAFVLGFQRLREVIPPFMGQPAIGACLENEQHDPARGEATQRTTAWHGLGGLLVWRKLDNWTGYTDGHRTWVNGPYGLELRLNTERFCWESDATPGTCLPSGGRPPGAVREERA